MKRNMGVRILAAFVWLIVIYFVSNMLIGAVVGGMAGVNAKSMEAAQIAGQRATLAFFQRYSLQILVGQITVFLLLISSGILPGTTKYR